MDGILLSSFLLVQLHFCKRNFLRFKVAVFQKAHPPERKLCLAGQIGAAPKIPPLQSRGYNLTTENMAEVVPQPQGSSSRGGGSGGRVRRGRGWRGRHRGGRGGSNANASGSGNGNVEGGQATTATTQPLPPPTAVPTPVPQQPTGVASQPIVSDASSSHQEGQPGRGRGDRGRGGRGRGRGRGGAAQRSIVTSHRGGRGPPFSAPRQTDSSSSQSQSQIRHGFNLGAVEFVPGQPVSVTTNTRGPGEIIPPRSAPAPKPVMEKSTAEDLPTRIHEDIDNGQYECVICTSEVVRSSRVWSCLICWTVTHLHCVKKWHKNQMKQKEENQSPNQPDGWRCPGCNSNLLEDPASYHCWCGKEFDMKAIPGLPPHTCGQTCSKPRATCPHPCSLMCHAGPCPPCTLMGPAQTCFCGKNTVTKRCSETDYTNGWSCQEVCGDFLPCGEHTCSQPCHPGLCGACDVPMPSTCYCGKERKEIPCNQRDDILESFNYGQLDDEEEWFEGSFQCSKVCGRKFDCGHHTCQKPCHPQDEETSHCPLSPDMVLSCPCGKTPLASLPAEPRTSCQDPVPRCDKPCDKILACGHHCPDKCHTGACAPCFQSMDVSCRCGRVTSRSACHLGCVEPPQCFRVCKAQLNCGRHECGERCCSGEKKAAERRKQKRAVNENYEPEHICLQVCGRLLKCSKHTCQQLCHRGSCNACPEAIFDEISCSCGRTVLHPPQPCGTRPPECRFDCRRARPCGHPAVSHQCHPDDVACPKCAFLVERPCICGKRILKNQPCWFEDARCGLPCGKKLKCGAHECRKSCHKPRECEDAEVVGSHCTQLCGRARKSCDHTCVDECHAPFRKFTALYFYVPKDIADTVTACNEDKPCQSMTFTTCPCQRQKKQIRCGATRFNSGPDKHITLKCDDDCLRLERNQRLADALNIDPNHTDDHVPYADKTLKMFRENITWAQSQERELRMFAADPELKRMRFKPMANHQRAFLHSLAEDYGLDSESQDPEPHRHVCLFKTPRFVSAPKKTLAQSLRLVKTAAATAAAAAAKPATPANSQPSPQAFNALLLTTPRFGLTVEEVDRALASDIAAAARSGPALSFTTSFLPSEDIVIKAIPNFTTAAIATSMAPTPQAVQSVLKDLKSAVARTISKAGLANGVVLCHADSSLNVVRREGDQAAGADGWSAVASKGTWRRAPSGKVAPPVASSSRAGGGFFALRKLELRKKKVEEEKAEVEEDWEAAAEKLEGGSSDKENEVVKTSSQDELQGHHDSEQEQSSLVATDT